MKRIAPMLAILVFVSAAFPAFAQDSEELAKKLANPIAALISVPLQGNYDHKYAPDSGGHKSFVNFQPVVPFTLNPSWTLISRTIVPVVSQHDVVPGTGGQDGIGDITQSIFFSPTKPGPNGLIWGAGPVFLLPTGSEALLSARKWGLGPTGVVLKQDGPWTYGALANHVWSFGGPAQRPGVSATFLQPFLNYTTKEAWTFGVNSESTYNWNQKEWSAPLNFTVSKLLKVGKQPISLGGGVRYWLTSPDSGPRGWGYRVTLTFLFPK